MLEKCDRNEHSSEGATKFAAASGTVRVAGVDDGQGACAEYSVITSKANLARTLMHKHELIFIVKMLI
jgi:hypothetical protein